MHPGTGFPMSGQEKEGWGLSSEHEEDQVQEVDTRSVDLDRLMAEKAKDPKATWSPEQTHDDNTER
jgi:hypothetical protein